MERIVDPVFGCGSFGHLADRDADRFLVASFWPGMFDGSASLQERYHTLGSDGDVFGVITFVAALVVCPFCWMLGYLRPGFSGWSDLGHAGVWWTQWLGWSGALIGWSVIFGWGAPFIGVKEPAEFMVSMGQSTQFPFMLFLGVVIGAPFVEEFSFRGFLWRGWR